MGPVGNDQYRDYVRDIYGSGSHLLSLINDILDFSKAEAGKLEVDIGEVNISKIIRNSMRLVMPRAQTAEVELLEAIPKDQYVIETDGKKVKQVILNLLSNAVKFTPPGGEVKVVMWENVLEDTITIEVRDSGIGIAAKDISKVMSPFGQVDSALSRKYEGTGLGLPLSRKFVEILGGKFDIRSKVNVGTVISFTLPKKYVSGEGEDFIRTKPTEIPAPEEEAVEEIVEEEADTPKDTGF
jgi:two-component system cell cycle sensor histidine kinase PleC